MLANFTVTVSAGIIKLLLQQEHSITCFLQCYYLDITPTAFYQY